MNTYVYIDAYIYRHTDKHRKPNRTRIYIYIYIYIYIHILQRTVNRFEKYPFPQPPCELT